MDSLNGYHVSDDFLNSNSNSSSSSKDTSQRVDPYGFERPESFNYESHEEMMSEYLAVLQRRSVKWSKLLQGNVKVEKNLKVKRYVRKGVPKEHRAQIWMAASGAQEQLEKHPGYYHSLLEQKHDAKLEETIRLDMHRTFPDNVLFRSSSDSGLQTSLYNVLLAYGHHNKDVGYCQGMNFIAGYLIIITKDEEKSFWLMDALLGRILPDYYTVAMLGLKTDQEVLGELVKVKVPAVWHLMQQHNVMWTLVVSRWFICLFIDILPVETVLRIWDCLFYEGSKILFRVALTLIRHHQTLLLQAQNLPDVCERFKQITHGEFVEDCHSFTQKIFLEPGSLSMATIRKLRQTCRDRIVAEEAALRP
ncbi:growth hormone-regulated TBC protein 1-A-like isoform X2 [Alosa sapidissima]|uniref:growth hormone-regulated TBC protein 1-A-like isoform X2 n=1 Tax=Alosa sapidissima TaxID=34773 RepID=UPI001C0A2714|nr:growth hormone-regulated TBC protein 1-A-like isoform X2 [Alosa sapidissima]